MKYDTNMNAKESYLQENESFLEKRSDFLGRVAELFIKSDVYKWQSCTDSYNTTKDGYTTGDIPEGKQTSCSDTSMLLGSMF